MTNSLGQSYSQIWPSQVFDGGTSSVLALDSAFVFETSGDFVGCQFVAPVASTTVDLWVYCTTETGAPTNGNYAFRNNDTTTAAKPEVGGAVIGTPGADTSFDGLSNTWVQMSQYAVTLTAGTPYFMYIHNKTATPASNHFTIRYRSASDGHAQVALTTLLLRGFSGTDGMAGAIAVHGGLPSFVMKFSNGDHLGWPYVAAMAAAASNTNWRGNRFRLTQDVWVNGAAAVLSGDTTNWKNGTCTIYQGATVIVTASIGLVQVSSTTLPIHFAKVKLYAGLAYDLVFQPAAATTDNPAYDMGSGSIPADVTAAGITGVTYVSGATPGSFTENTNAIFRCALLLESAPVDRYPRSRMINS